MLPLCLRPLKWPLPTGLSERGLEESRPSCLMLFRNPDALAALDWLCISMRGLARCAHDLVKGPLLAVQPYLSNRGLLLPTL